MLEIVTANSHLENIRKIAKDKTVSILDALNHYTEVNGYDPYFIADIVHTDKTFLSEIQKEAKNLKLLK
jgi:hypothetical protein